MTPTHSEIAARLRHFGQALIMHGQNPGSIVAADLQGQLSRLTIDCEAHLLRLRRAQQQYEQLVQVLQQAQAALTASFISSERLPARSLE